MSFRLKIKKKIIAVLLTMLPAFVVGSLVIGANVYYDLDSGTVRTFENSAITGNFSVTGNSTIATDASTTNTFGSGASSINTIGSATTPGALTLHGATTLDNTLIISGANLTSLGGNLTFSGATPAISASTAATDISLDAGTTGKIKIGGTSTGDIEFAGGSGSTGCTITTAGILTCSGNITGPTTGTVGYWTRSGITLSQATADDALSLGAGTITTTGTITSGLINSQTISSAANFTGTVTAATSFLAPTIDTATGVALNIGTATQTALTLGRAGAATTINGSGLIVGPTAWTATPTISGLVTMTAGFDSNAASTAAGLTVDGNGDLIVSNGILSVTAPNTTGNAGAIVANSLTTGAGLDISSASTAGGASGVSKLLNLSRSGVNSNTAHTAYGVYSSVTNTNATSGTNIAGYFSASGATTANYGLIVASGNVGIGTVTPSSMLTLSASSDFAIGDYNSNLIDDMEVITDWTLTEVSGTGESTRSLESANVRKGSGAMKITTTAGSSNTDYVRKTFGSSQNYLSYERIGFWIKATETGQIISFRINDFVGGTSAHTVTISEANQWQYEEYNISGITPKDAITWADFYINDDTSSPIFYIDQARVYDYDERTSEMFVDNDGNLVVWGRGGIELGRGVPGSSLAGMKIGSANIELNQPLNVNVAGDTGMAYDLQFLNTGGANITSLGALTISAGDPNKTQNLTLSTQSNQMSGDSGVATSSTSKITTDSSKVWTVDEWIGGTMYIISGVGVGQERIILDNDATTITVDDAGTATDWSPVPDSTSSYHLAYMQGGDVIVDVANSSNNYGGFKVAGMDDGSYVFRVGPDGNVEIGGNGSAGSNLTVKQNLTLTGGNITVNKLAISQAGTPSGDASTTGGSMAAATYYYSVTALNNNGETTRSTESSGVVTTGATSSVVLSWISVSGATGYKIYRTTSSGTYTTPALITFVSSPVTTYTDIATSASSGAPPASNTTGGKIAINTSSPSVNLEVLENTSATAQMRLISDGSNFGEFYVNSTGDLTIDTTGSGGDDVRILDQNLRVCEGGTLSSDSCPGGTLSDQGNLVVENKIYTSGNNENMPRHTCPTGWVLVPGNSTFGTEDFCVMKYEAKQNSSTKNPESVAAGTPWVSVSQYEAKNACQRIGAHLVNEAEWMTIARNIEATTINDLDSDASLQLGNGNSTSAAAYAAVTDPVISSCSLTVNLEDAANAWSSTCQLQGTNGNTADFGYTSDGASNFSIAYNSAADSKAHIRTHVLSNGNVLWDIAGNVWEWTDAQCDTTSWNYYSAAWVEWNSASNPDLSNYERIVAGSTAYTSTNGVGQYYGCTASGNAFFRGGDWNEGANAGAFTLYLGDVPSLSYTGLGFRCSR